MIARQVPSKSFFLPPNGFNPNASRNPHKLIMKGKNALERDADTKRSENFSFLLSEWSGKLFSRVTSIASVENSARFMFSQCFYDEHTVEGLIGARKSVEIAVSPSTKLSRVKLPVSGGRWGVKCARCGFCLRARSHHSSHGEVYDACLDLLRRRRKSINSPWSFCWFRLSRFNFSFW